MGKGGGHLPIPGNVKKCYRVKKNHLRSHFEQLRRDHLEGKSVLKNLFFAGAVPQTQLGELTALVQTR